jgi:hypothetical protein
MLSCKKAERTDYIVNCLKLRNFSTLYRLLRFGRKNAPAEADLSARRALGNGRIGRPKLQSNVARNPVKGGGVVASNHHWLG